MRIVGLFSGVGGFELGFWLLRHEIILVADADPSCREILGRAPTVVLENVPFTRFFF